MATIIYAPNVHQGGGRTLLLALLGASDEVKAVVDSRLDIPSEIAGERILCRVAPSVLARLRAELWVRKIAGSDDVLVFFGNLPPVFRLPGKKVLFLQNRYLLKAKDTRQFPLVVRCRLAVERFLLRRGMRQIDQFVVQTHSMATELREELGVDADVLPFADRLSAHGATSPDGRCGPRFDYVYVASPEPHKNHFRLLQAWLRLHEQGLSPSLALTVRADDLPPDCREVQVELLRRGAQVHFLGPMPQSAVESLYANAGALIYPSMFESFGLPLVDANACGLPILAGELDYVRDLVDPAESFDPASAISIARAVARHMNRPLAKLGIVGPEEFLAHVGRGAR